MIIKKTNKTKNKIIETLYRLINKIENIGNSYMDKNGEINFINNISELYKDNFIFFDVGANIGKYSSIILKNINNKANYDFHLFEPQKKCFADLSEKFINEKIHLNNFGLSDKEENATIFYNQEKSGLASLYKRDLDYYKIKMDKEENILLKRADDYIKYNNIKKINLMKIDVEGHEIKALKGFGKYLNSDFIDFIQFEYGGANLDSRTNLNDLYKIFNRNGFTILKIMPKYLEEKSYNPRMENFVYQNYIAISNKILPKINEI